MSRSIRIAVWSIACVVVAVATWLAVQVSPTLGIQHTTGCFNFVIDSAGNSGCVQTTTVGRGFVPVLVIATVLVGFCAWRLIRSVRASR